jgi:hypothetical protein
VTLFVLLCQKNGEKLFFHYANGEKNLWSQKSRILFISSKFSFQVERLTSAEYFSLVGVNRNQFESIFIAGINHVKPPKGSELIHLDASTARLIDGLSSHERG